MEQEGGSAATELPMCNYGKPSAVQISITKKNSDRRFWGCEGRNLYENKSTRMQCLKIKVQKRNMEKNKSTGTSKWVLTFMYEIVLFIVFKVYKKYTLFMKYF